MARPQLQPREDREVFVVPLDVRPEHIDENNHVNNVVYVGWLQDVGTAHWNARFDDETRARWSWIALRHEIDYLRAIAPDATGVVARTWVGDPQGPRFNRYVASRTPKAACARKACPNGAWSTPKPCAPPAFRQRCWGRSRHRRPFSPCGRSSSYRLMGFSTRTGWPRSRPSSS